MSNKDIGIIGYWFATNYGGVASYFSLYKKIEEMGYQPFLVETPYLDTDKEGIDTFPRHFFEDKNVRISKWHSISELYKLNELANTFILGSDQVLTSSSIRAFGKLFLMEFAQNDKKKIAISSSCGGDNLNVDENLIDYTRRQLYRFDAISVREYSAVNIIKNKFNIETEVTIDPIFFTSKEEYESIGKIKDEKSKKKYILAYILDPSEDKRNGIYKISEELGLEVKIALDGRKFTYDKNFKEMGMEKETLPELNFNEWLYYFNNASYVFTDSFHGASMAIIMNKPFIMYANHRRGYPRFQTLAQIFNIKNRLIEKSDDVIGTLIKSDIDFEYINKTIALETIKAEKWLKNALVKEKVSGLVLNNVDILYSNPDFIKIRILATLFRDYGIKHIVLSPGGRDVPLVRMFEYNENQFILHHVTDERSAAYFGLGIAAQLQQPVVCVCTSGTAASNYLPAVTEAYYTGVPLIVVTADRREIYLNHGEDQTIPQKNIYHGVVKKEISLPEGSGYHAEYQTRRDISECILESTHNGFGPVHINISIDNISIGANIPREYWKLLPRINQHLLRVGISDGASQMMRWVNALKQSKRILVVYGQNVRPTEKQKQNIELFASKYNCVIVTDFISNLDCAYSLKPYNMLQAISKQEFDEQLSPDILITVGGKRLMNDPLTFKVRGGRKDIRHWSITPDGKVKDFYFRLTSVIEMSQDYFFEWFANHAGNIINDGMYYGKWRQLTEKYNAPEIIKFNAHYIQSKFIPNIPSGSMLHLGVGQSFYDCRRYVMDKTVEVFCNMGTNGIDGCTSTFMGQCCVIKDKLCFLLVGDLSFFYDMNSIWDKKLNKNMRILLVNNNGTGLLRGHNLKNISSIHNTTAKGWVESTGFEYICANSKEEFDNKLVYFLSTEPQKALFFEVLCQ